MSDEVKATSRILRDSSGMFDLENVHSVTPYVTHQEVEEPISKLKVKKIRHVAQIHNDSGHSFTTDTDYDTVAKQVFGN